MEKKFYGNEPLKYFSALQGREPYSSVTCLRVDRTVLGVRKHQRVSGEEQAFRARGILEA